MIHGPLVDIGIVSAARMWWRSKRPPGWSLAAHVHKPWVNCNTKEEVRLAMYTVKTYSAYKGPRR